MVHIHACTRTALLYLAFCVFCVCTDQKNAAAPILCNIHATHHLKEDEGNLKLYCTNLSFISSSSPSLILTHSSFLPTPHPPYSHFITPFHHPPFSPSLLPTSSSFLSLPLIPFQSGIIQLRLVEYGVVSIMEKI